MSTALAPLRALSDLVQRTYWAARGMTFKGKRNVAEALGYKEGLDVSDYRLRYRRGGVASRIVEALPNATWRGGAELIEDEDPTVSTEFEEAFETFDERLHVWSKLRRLDIVAGLGEYGVMLIGAPGSLESPLPRTLDIDSISFLSVYAQDEAKIVQTVQDIKNVRYGQPEFYNLTRRGVTNKRTAGVAPLPKVHFSRVLHIADGVIDDEVFGYPRLERVWNLLDDLDKVVGAGAEAFWQRVQQGLHFNLDKDTTIDEIEERKLKDHVDEYMHGLRRMVMTRGMDLTPLGADVANFLPPADAIITQISGATGIPKRILVGSERGELASTQDKTNWDERVEDRRQEWAEPYVVRPLVQMLIEHKALPEPAEWHVRWPELKKLDDVQKSTVAVQWSNLNKNAGGTVVMPEEIRDLVLGLEPLSEEQKAEVEEQKAAAMEEQMSLMEAQAKAKGGAPTNDKSPGPGQKPPKAAASGGTQQDQGHFRRQHTAADRHQSRLSRVVERSVNAAVNALDEAALIAAVESRDFAQIDMVLEPISARMYETFQDVEVVLAAVVGESGELAANSANRRGLK